MQADILVSIIVPIYNTETYLERCVRSIQSQTYFNLEIILVDDGSTDSCPEICDKFIGEDNCIKVIHQYNQGPGIARNSGIDSAKGEWLCFVDSDDYIHPRYVELLLQTALENDCPIVQCGLTQGSDSDFKEVKQPPLKIQTMEWTEFLYYCYDNPEHGICSFYCNIFHKSLFSGLRFSGLKFSEDAALFPKIINTAASRKLAVVNQKLYYYYKNPMSICRKEINLSHADITKGFQAASSFLKEKQEFELADLYLHIYFPYMIKYFFELSIEFPKEYPKYADLKKEIYENAYKEAAFCRDVLKLHLYAKNMWQRILNSKIVMYGYGNVGKKILPWLKFFVPVLEIWDKSVKTGDEAYSIPLRPSHDGLDKDYTIIFAIAKQGLALSVQKELRKMGYKNFIHLHAFNEALKYAKYERFLPELLKTEVI